MTLPIDLVLVRHGESEGNVALKRSYAGDDSLYTEQFRHIPSTLWQLTSKGQQEMQITGQWIKDHVLPSFDIYMVSNTLRTYESAAFMALENAKWEPSPYLMERDWGELATKPVSERQELFANALKSRPYDTLSWRPPNGESLLDVISRGTRIVLDSLHRKQEEKNCKSAILVCHGEMMWTFRYLIERMPLDKWYDLEHSGNPQDRIHNGQVLHYTRQNPENPKDIRPHMKWMRSVCPYDHSVSSSEWRKLKQRKLNNAELLTLVNKISSHKE